MWHYRNSPESCHYVIDEEKIYRCVPDRVVSNPQSFGPPGSIVINVCGEPKASVLDWSTIEQAKVLALAAELVAELVIRHKIPLRYLSEDEAEWALKRWFFRRANGGIVLTVAGQWPKEYFLGVVKYRVMQQKRENQ